jgi:hypothetical protein
MSTDHQRLLHSLGSVAIFGCLLLALFHAMFFLIEPGAPLRQSLAGDFKQLTVERQTAQVAGKFTDAAGGGNLALHFEGFSAADPLLARFYFLASYTLYPNRVIVGRGSQIINSQSQVEEADLPPDDRWLMQNDVRAVMTIERKVDGGLDIQTRQLR